MYPFGYGLSYTDFAYSQLHITQAKDEKGERIEIRFDIKNTGSYEGEEIAQLYIWDRICSVTRPVKELKRFKKVGLKPGESKTVIFKLSASDLKFYNRKMEYVVEPGEFKIMIGASSEDIRLRGKIVIH